MCSMSSSKPMSSKSAWRPRQKDRGCRMKKFSKSHHGTMHELNITPLLDLAFVLLVIFIITTAPSVNDLDLNLPDPKAKKGASNIKPNLITVNAEGKVSLNQKEMDFAALRQELDRMRKADKDITVI